MILTVKSISTSKSLGTSLFHCLNYMHAIVHIVCVCVHTNHRLAVAWGIAQYTNLNLQGECQVYTCICGM